MRPAIGALGVLVGLYGAWLLLSRADAGDLLSLAFWLVGGVLAHDVGVAAVTLMVAVLAMRWLPSAARMPAAAGLVVLGTLTVVAIPFLGRFGAREDNPTLLDRNYVGGYLVVVALVVICVVVASVVRSRHSTNTEIEAR
ncbi:hypothetical protein BH24ACT8_BH24ACT8_20530 [soil metagenome]